jgi:hypothetical protein
VGVVGQGVEKQVGQTMPRQMVRHRRQAIAEHQAIGVDAGRCVPPFRGLSRSGGPHIFGQVQMRMDGQARGFRVAFADGVENGGVLPFDRDFSAPWVV